MIRNNASKRNINQWSRKVYMIITLHSYRMHIYT